MAIRSRGQRWTSRHQRLYETDPVVQEVAGLFRWQNDDDRLNEREESCVYFLRAVGHGIKLGKTDDLLRRINALQGGCPYKLVLVGTLSGGFPLERVLKERFRSYRLRGEWYSEEILPDVLALLADDAGWYASTA